MILPRCGVIRRPAPRPHAFLETHPRPRHRLRCSDNCLASRHPRSSIGVLGSTRRGGPASRRSLPRGSFAVRNLGILVVASLAVLGPSSVRAEDKPPPGPRRRNAWNWRRSSTRTESCGTSPGESPPDQGEKPKRRPVPHRVDGRGTSHLVRPLDGGGTRRRSRPDRSDRSGPGPPGPDDLGRSGQDGPQGAGGSPLRERGRRIEQFLACRYRPRRVRKVFPEVTRRFSDAARYFRLEAEAWLAKEKAGR